MDSNPRIVSVNSWNWKERILYQDDFVCVADKPYGIPVHETKDPKREDMTRLLQDHLQVPYLRCVNRLDLQTTGLVLFCKDPKANLAVDEMIKNSQKTYHAMVHGIVPWKEKRIESFLKDGNKRVQTVRSGGRKAITEFTQLLTFSISSSFLYSSRFGDCSSFTFSLETPTTLVSAKLITGRRHQIRVHISESGNPILGDPVYGNSQLDSPFLKAMGSQKLILLHAQKLEFLPIGSETENKVQVVSDWGLKLL